MKKAVITVIGKDTVGIIARVCTYLSENGVNIEDISQTVLQDYFTMMMIVDISRSEKGFDELSAELSGVGEGIGVSVRMQHEDIFNIMHRV